jgi:hypothetical protein
MTVGNTRPRIRRILLTNILNISKCSGVSQSPHTTRTTYVFTFYVRSALLSNLCSSSSGKRYFFYVKPLSLSIFRLRREMRYCDALVMILG